MNSVVAMARIGLRQALFGDRHLDEGAGRDQPVDDAGRAIGLAGERRLRPDGAIGRDLERALAGGRHARRLRRAGDHRHAEARL